MRVARLLLCVCEIVRTVQQNPGLRIALEILTCNNASQPAQECKNDGGSPDKKWANIVSRNRFDSAQQQVLNSHVGLSAEVPFSFFKS